MDLRYVEMVIKGELPFGCFVEEEFRAFVSWVQPRYKIPNREKMGALVWDLYLSEKAKVASVIGDQRVSITADTWTSIHGVNYMVVTAHFMDSDWNSHRKILNFRKITSHDGDEIGKRLEVCLSDWGIEEVFTITIDSVTNSDVAVSCMKRRFRALSTLLCDGEYLHLRSACHVINLIVKDGLEELFTSIEGIRNAVKFIHSSSVRLDKFREFAILENKENMANVPMDVSTRWDSTYKMLDVAFKYKLVFDRMRDENAEFVGYFQEELRDGTYRVGPPTDEDWEKAQAFVHFLKMFYDKTLKLSATKTVTSDSIFAEMARIQYEIEKKMRDVADPVLQRVATSMKSKFDKYWELEDDKSVNKLVYVADVLDPRWKMLRVKSSFKFNGADTDKVEKVTNDVKQCLIKLYNEYKGGDEDVNDELSEDDDLDDWMMELRKENKIIVISNEVDKYLNDPYENHKDKGFKLLDWWKQNQQSYPVLSKIAKDIFAIPGSAVSTENAFSSCNRVVDPFRTSLAPKMVEALVCTSDWLRAEEFSFYKEPTDNELAFYRELEEN